MHIPEALSIIPDFNFDAKLFSAHNSSMKTAITFREQYFVVHVATSKWKKPNTTTASFYILVKDKKSFGAFHFTFQFLLHLLNSSHTSST